MGDADLHGVLRVVEVNDVNVKDQNGRAGDEVSCGGREGGRRERSHAEKIFKDLGVVGNSPTPSPP